MRGWALGPVPLLEPLAYPGRVVDAPALLRDGEVVPLPDHYSVEGRVPVLAVGSNGSPAQLSHKLAQEGVSGTVPMVPVRVRGVGVGLSGHVSRMGYVSASPYLERGADAGVESELVVTWLDAGQLEVVDRTEMPNFGRAFLPGDEFPVTGCAGRTAAAGGLRLEGAYIYFNVRGVLGYPDGSLRAGGEQRAVLAGLLGDSARLRELFGDTPESWVARVRDDPGLAGRGTAALQGEGWVIERGEFRRYAV